jgi:hypothetical protein
MFVMALAYHLNRKISFVGSFFLTPTILTIEEIYLENTREKDKKQEPTLHVKLNGGADDLVETWNT